MTESFEIRKEVTLPTTPDQVWEAIATEAGLAAWFMPMPVDPNSGMVVAWEPGRRLAVRTPVADDGATQAFEYLIEARDQGTTVLRFVHSGVLGADWAGEFEAMTSSGWDMYLATLSEYLTHFAGRPAQYIEAEGPPPSARPECWPRLAEALGLASAVTPGRAARVDLPDLGPIDGEVDYVGVGYVGIRTTEALIRFHGRASIGMTVAVSHHAYAPVDAEATTKAWARWLASVFAE